MTYDPGGAVTVLLVEDDDDSREIMAEVLAAAGYAVRAVSSGPAALRTLAESSVDLVVTDMGMPGMGGLEMARAAREIAPTVPVVLVTGWVEQQEIAQARGREVVAVLVKPVDPDELTRVVAAAVAVRRGGQGR